MRRGVIPKCTMCLIFREDAEELPRQDANAARTAGFTGKQAKFQQTELTKNQARRIQLLPAIDFPRLGSRSVHSSNSQESCLWQGTTRLPGSERIITSKRSRSSLSS